MMGKRKTAAALAGMMVVTMLGGAAVPQQVTASSLLTVDCGDVIREVTHCASGSLYGVTESIPADIDTLVTPLYPNVFTNPARAGSAYQQPSGAAIETAERPDGDNRGGDDPSGGHLPELAVYIPGNGQLVRAGCGCH